MLNYLVTEFCVRSCLLLVYITDLIVDCRTEVAVVSTETVDLAAVVVISSIPSATMDTETQEVNIILLF